MIKTKIMPNEKPMNATPKKFESNQNTIMNGQMKIQNSNVIKRKWI